MRSYYKSFHNIISSQEFEFASSQDDSVRLLFTLMEMRRHIITNTEQ